MVFFHVYPKQVNKAISKAIPTQYINEFAIQKSLQS